MSEPDQEKDAAQDGAVDPVSQMLVSAIAIHEQFAAFQAAGFSESQATYLAGVWLAEAIRRSPHG